MKRPAGCGHSLSDRLHHLLAGTLKTLTHDHCEVSQAAACWVQVNLTWEHRSAALVQEQENAHQKNFAGSSHCEQACHHISYCFSQPSINATDECTFNVHENVEVFFVDLPSLLTNLSLVIKLDIFSHSCFDSNPSRPAPAPPASVPQLWALPTVAPFGAASGSCDTGVITPRTPPSADLTPHPPALETVPKIITPAKKAFFPPQIPPP